MKMKTGEQTNLNQAVQKKVQAKVKDNSPKQQVKDNPCRDALMDCYNS